MDHVDCIEKLIRFSRSMVNPKWTKVGWIRHFSSFLLHDNFMWIDWLHIFILWSHPMWSPKLKHIKDTSNRKAYTSESETEKLYVNVEILY
jgi:hypothetical protein